ncbi:FecR family protein [Pedobacter heparinus]|uniref:FecR protein n=1 Tax=Pedobacter heparinus (strain ATCC 13125 / DSM 2366 / CIP 104194 / JCM 7457 / NBRC 12017 / NCIMB 9290 / NRRL B-14731 / HIM 762-3) TaxID=485917 RepID=C6XVX8_PEDHD|nr:FecR family protein [Pedobacter heparinus]ACU06203.1 FecR protein [Pedobacter heparinus DSM 2366]
MENPIKQLFVNFILNRCSPAEIKQVEELVKNGGHELEWRTALEETEQEFANSEHADLVINERELFKRINYSIGTSVPSRQKLWGWLTAAASIILIAGVGLWLMRSEMRVPHAMEAKSSSVQARKDTTHKWIKLPDGSSVQLNYDSYLEYADSFEGKALREVRLIGEAYFDIKHDAKHPFVIHTGKIKTTVLGTAFNISAYQASKAVTVTVTRGKVKVEDEDRTLAILTPDQQLAWSARLPEPVKAKVNAEVVLEWKKQDLIMDDITLMEAAQMITERYGVKVRFNNEKVKTCRFTAAFLNRNDINQVLNVVADITGARLTLENNIVTIEGPGC